MVGAKPDGCVLCAKAQSPDDEADQVLHRGEYCFVVVNAYPYNSGHVMVVPYEHVSDLTDVRSETVCEMMSLAQACIRAMRRCMYPDGVNIGMNIGKAAGAGIDEHIHLHIIPRWEGDTNFMTTCCDTRVVPQAIADSACALKPVLEEEVGRDT